MNADDERAYLANYLRMLAGAIESGEIGQMDVFFSTQVSDSDAEGMEERLVSSIAPWRYEFTLTYYRRPIDLSDLSEKTVE